jgi:acetyl-CoA carboxylase beta subunit
MNWISNYVRPKINSLFSRREVPENLWTKCDECGTMLFHRELSDNLNVCTNCNHHMQITPRARFHALFDGGVFTEVKVPEPLADPLQFRDQKKYPDRMKAAQKATGEPRRCWWPRARSGGRPSWPRRRTSPSWRGPWGCTSATPSSRRPSGRWS